MYRFTDSSEQANYSLGVHWLMRAADQGHQSALEMLSECYRTRRGINDRNECEVCGAAALHCILGKVNVLLNEISFVRL